MAGAIYSYVFDGNDWILEGSEINGQSDNEHLGRTLSANHSGTRVVGSGNTITRAYEFDGSSWQQLGSDFDASILYQLV